MHVGEHHFPMMGREKQGCTGSHHSTAFFLNHEHLSKVDTAAPEMFGSGAELLGT